MDSPLLEPTYLLEYMEHVVHLSARPYMGPTSKSPMQLKTHYYFCSLEILLDLEINSLLPTHVTNKSDSSNILGVL